MDFLMNVKMVEVPLVGKRKNKKYFIGISSRIIDSSHIMQLASNVKWLINEKVNVTKNILIRIQFKNVLDMPTIVVMEYLLYLLVKNKDFLIKFQLDHDRRLAINEYVEKSYLSKFNHNYLNKEIIEEYFKVGYRNIRNNHFRVYLDAGSEENVALLAQDAISFLKGANIFNKGIINSIAEVISELGINMIEHANSPYVTEIHVKDSFVINDGRTGKLISITIYNTSNIKLYTNLKNLVKADELRIEQKTLYKAYDYHKSKFNDYYNDNDFFMISTFQRGISSRRYDNQTSGTGLTKVICNIVDQLDDPKILDEDKLIHCYSYVLSGENVLHLERDMIKESVSKEIKQIGFNKTMRYLDDIPDRSAIDRSKFYYNGTIFYLRLFLEEK